MAEVNYAWGSERPSARRARLKRQLEAGKKAEEALLAKQALEREQMRAALAVREADLLEVDLMTHGGTVPYDRSLEADPKIADRPRVMNTQALYGRGAKLKRSTLPTQVIAVGDSSRQIRKGVKGAGRKRTGKARSPTVAPERSARDAASSEVVDTVEMVPAGTSKRETVSLAPMSEILVRDPSLQSEADVETGSVLGPDPDPVPELVAAPAVSTAQKAEIRSALTPRSGATGTPTIASARVYDFFSPRVEAEIAGQQVPARLPKAFDPTWADHWERDPNAPLPEMLDAFQAFGAAIDKDPQDLTDEEAHLLGLSVVFPTLIYDRSAGRKVPNPDAYRPGQPIDTHTWEKQLRQAGDTVQKLVLKWNNLVDLFREEERIRRKMWPLALARRDYIKTLMSEVSLGTLSFAPRTAHMSDLDRSVQWNVFRRADHEPILLYTHAEMELYQQRILDKLPWPEGLSRLELMAKFGEGMPVDGSRGIVAYSRPAKWLVPDYLWFASQSFSLLTIDRQPFDVGMASRPPTGGEVEEVRTAVELRVTVDDGGDDGGEVIDPTRLSDLAEPLRDGSQYNRLLVLPADRDTGHISFAADLAVIREALASGDPVPFCDPRLAALDDWQSPEPVVVGGDAIRARLERLVSDDGYLAEESGASQMRLALNLVERTDQTFDAAVDPEGGPTERIWAAPLMLCPVMVEGLPDAPTLRRIGVPVPNPALCDHLGIDRSALPEDPLTWTREDLAAYGVTAIVPGGTLGLFELPAYQLWERLNPLRYRSLSRSPKVQRLLAGTSDEPWPQIPHRAPTTPTLLSKMMDGVQADLIVLSRFGVSMAIQGGPGTGKTQVIFHVIANAMAEGRSVLFMSGRTSAFRAVLSRFKGTVYEPLCLRLFGSDCEPRAVAARHGGEPAETVRDTLIGLQNEVGMVMATPATYAMHVPANWRFDLLVVDEASLVTLAEALPAVAMSEQMVVCGDLQQMQKDPPVWRLWDRERPYVPPMTLLEAVIAARMPEAMLRHHYRSRHPALIHVANWTYYDALMRVAPSPDTSGVSPYRVHEVAGTFDWDTCVNAIEAEAVVDALDRHLASGSTASVGIITMTLQQRDLIRRRIAERELDLAPIEGVESLVVADYNGIQGEERDVIFISLTFGPRAGETAPPTSYGAISLPDGEKRLNVIMTRSRDRMTVLASFPWSSINQARTKGHSKLGIFLANGHGTYAQMPDPYDGVLAKVLKIVAWQARDLGNAIAMFDPQSGRFAGAIFITGERDELTERSERAQYENSGWQVYALPREQLAELEVKPEARQALADVLFSEFSAALLDRSYRSGMPRILAAPVTGA